MAAGKKRSVVVNPRLASYNQFVEWEGYTFSLDEPVAITAEEYERLSELTADFGGGTFQLCVLAKAADVSATQGSDEGQTEKEE